MNRPLAILSLLPLSTAFFTLGGHGCGCPPAASAPCPPPPVPICHPHPPCAVAHGAKTSESMPLALPDELALRAAAFGIPLSPVTPSSANIEQLERLGDESGTFVENNDQMVYSNYQYRAEDADLFTKEIRRAPVINFSKDEQIETTTVAAESSSVKGDEGEEMLPAETKCNSQVLHSLMLENMSDNSSLSKRNVNKAAETKFGGSVDVICSRGHFSYVFSSNLFCEATKGLTTCIAFRQSA